MKCCLSENKTHFLNLLLIYLSKNMAIYPRTSGSNVHKKTSQIYFFMTENQTRESRVVCRKAPLFLWMGMEPQLHGPSTFSYQGKGAAFGQINPLLRSLLKSGLFSYETIYPLINIAKSLELQNPRFQDKIFIFWRGNGSQKN